MKWSFTGGLELNSLTGFILPFGNKKKRLLTHQIMHNLQRKFDHLQLFLLFCFLKKKR